MPRGFGLAALLLLTLLFAEVQFWGVLSQARLGAVAARRGLRQSAYLRSVETCEELQDALKDVEVLKIIVNGRIVCTPNNWKEPIIVRRNLEVTGEISKQGMNGRPFTNSTDLLQHSINWTNVSKVLVVERGAVVFFQDMLMHQSDMGVVGLSLAFIHTRQSATGVFAGIVMVVASCPQSVARYSKIFEFLERPEYLLGEQRTEVLGPSSLLVVDIAILSPTINSVWQICNTVLECGVTDPADPRIVEHFQNPELEPRCLTLDGGPSATGAAVSDNAVPREVGDREAPMKMSSSGSGRGTGVVGTVVLVVAVTGLVVVMTAGMTYYLIFRGRKQMSANNARTKKQSEPSTRGQRDGKHDVEGRRNSIAYDIFEKNINVPLQGVEVGTLLGRGGFGKVYKGTWKGTTVAIKVIEHGERLMENELKLPFEAYLSKHISHPNVVQTFLIHTRQQDSPHGVTVDTMDLNESVSHPVGDKSSLMSTHDIFSNMAKGSVGNEGSELFETWLVLEYCDRGSLAKAVRKGLLSHQKTMKPIMDHVLLSALDVANAMNYLHSLGITHGDLKADNVLLKSASTDRRGFFCKVSDFGLSRFMGKSSYIQTFTYGTITHMPPELLKDGILTSSADIYSFGMLLWELLSNTQPYSEKNHGEIILAVVNEGRRPHISPGFPDCYADLIRDCWKQNRHDRPKFPDIIRRLKQMLVNLETYGTPGGASVTDSAGSLSIVRRIGEPSMMGGRQLAVSPVEHRLDSVLPDVAAPVPEMKSCLYYDNTHSIESKDAEDSSGLLLLSHHSDGIIGGFGDDGGSNNSEYSMSDGFRSATSQVTRSSDNSTTSRNSPIT